MKSMSFTVFSYNATVLLIQPNPTQPNPTHVQIVHLCGCAALMVEVSAVISAVLLQNKAQDSVVL